MSKDKKELSTVIIQKKNHDMEKGGERYVEVKSEDIDDCYELAKKIFKEEL